MNPCESVKTFRIKKGRNIPLKGEAATEISDLPLPGRVAIQPAEFRGIKARLQVKVGDRVGAGSVLVSDKVNPSITIVSPVSGQVIAIKRGLRRSLEGIVIKVEGLKPAEKYTPIKTEELSSISRDDIIALMLKCGVWPFVRQRPFSKVANPTEKPKSIFIQGMNTEPLAPDIDFVLRDKKKLFSAGIEMIAKLTDGPVHLCHDPKTTSDALLEAPLAHRHTFSGPHPAGNISTHIHYIDPILKNDLIWYLSAQDVLLIAATLLNGFFTPERIIALTGEGVEENGRKYYRTIIGVPLESLLGRAAVQDKRLRYISGNVLTGRDVGKEGYLTYYAGQVHVLPEGGARKFLGWITPGLNKISLTRTHISAFSPSQKHPASTDIHGSLRAIVMNDVYDSLVPLDIFVFFLVRAILAGDIEEAEALGILECDEEDFSLCTFACPSKVDVSGIIRQGLDMVEKEG